jgi:hypothetical protein
MYPNNTFIAGTAPLGAGKYYWEVLSLPVDSNGTTGTFAVSVGVTNSSGGTPAGTNSYRFNVNAGTKTDNTNTTTPYGNSAYSGSVVGVAFDATAGNIWFSVNGVWQNSGNPATGANPAFTNLLAGPFYTVAGGTGDRVGFNFGQMPWVHQAPTGFGPVIIDNEVTTLTFVDDTNLDNMSVGDTVNQVTGFAQGVVSAVNVGAKQLNVVFTQGTWVVGRKVENADIIIPAPAPTTEPPNPLQYTLTDTVVGSAVDLTSWTVAKPPLTAATTYYTRVRYTSNAPVTVSDWSPWNQITTGSL